VGRRSLRVKESLTRLRRLRVGQRDTSSRVEVMSNDHTRVYSHTRVGQRDTSSRVE